MFFAKAKVYFQATNKMYFGKKSVREIYFPAFKEASAAFLETMQKKWIKTYGQEYVEKLASYQERSTELFEEFHDLMTSAINLEMTKFASDFQEDRDDLLKELLSEAEEISKELSAAREYSTNQKLQRWVDANTPKYEALVKKSRKKKEEKELIAKYEEACDTLADYVMPDSWDWKRNAKLERRLIELQEQIKFIESFESRHLTVVKDD